MRTFRYRVTHRSAEGLVVFRGQVQVSPTAASTGHVRGRILSDLARAMEFEVTEIYPAEDKSGKAVA